MTDPIDVAALVERLRQHACVIELVVATQKREPAAVMDEAARTLLSLSTRATIAEASLATMREALEQIATDFVPDTVKEYGMAMEEMRECARAVLAKEGK